jgi:hypothetical protein
VKRAEVSLEKAEARIEFDDTKFSAEHLPGPRAPAARKIGGETGADPCSVRGYERGYTNPSQRVAMHPNP